MKPKKASRANLEKFRLIFFETGMILVLALILMAFEWKSPEKPDEINLNSSALFFLDSEQVISTPRKPEVEINKPRIATIINTVEDTDIEVDMPDFSTEIDPYDGLGDWIYNSLPEEKFNEEEPEFVIGSEMPTFNGGKPEIEFNKYISENLRYPDIAAENGVEGRVILTFVIDKSGKLVDLSVYHPAHPDLDRAALEVVKKSPPWTPGMQSGKKVRVRYYFPVVFNLQ